MITMADLVLRPSRCAGLLVAICLCAPVYLAHAQGSRARADVAGLLKKHDEALNQHNLEGLLALYAPSPRTVTLGTGPGEKYQGKAEIKAAYTEIFKDFDKGTLRAQLLLERRRGQRKRGLGSGHVQVLRCQRREGECCECEFFAHCGGYFKWPRKDYDCSGVKTLFRTLRDASAALRHDLNAFTAARKGTGR